ncbi:MAG TPA: HAD family hydrolase [Phycisphaerae bacterium]|nr:HAD family hydrolase [Phycisphaerae bacterium]
MVGAVLFDLGDTLFDLQTNDPRRYLEQGTRLAHRYLVERGFGPPPLNKYLPRIVRAVQWAYLRSRITLREIQLIDLIVRTHRKMGIRLDAASAEQYARHCHEPIRRVFKVTPGADETLRRVREAGYAVGLVSNTFMISKVMDEDLRAADLLDLFDVRVWSCDVGYAKPHPIIFRVALERLGVEADRTMFVGDLIDTDVKGAKRLGMTTVLKVSDGRLPPGRYRPDHVIRRITEVPALLRRCRVA